MKNYREYITSTSNILSYREPIEWSNFWIDKANENVDKRILLIGDSNARNIRRPLQEAAKCPVDLLASSGPLDDVFFINQVDAFFNATIYRYDVIFVQVGHHGIRSRSGNLYSSEEDYNKFEKDFIGLISFLKQFSDKIIVESNFDNVEPVSKVIKIAQHLNLTKETPYKPFNDIKHKKNIIMHSVVKNYCSQGG